MVLEAECVAGDDSGWGLLSLVLFVVERGFDGVENVGLETRWRVLHG